MYATPLSEGSDAVALPRQPVVRRMWRTMQPPVRRMLCNNELWRRYLKLLEELLAQNVPGTFAGALSPATVFTVLRPTSVRLSGDSGLTQLIHAKFEDKHPQVGAHTGEKETKGRCSSIRELSRCCSTLLVALWSSSTI